MLYLKTTMTKIINLNNKTQNNAPKFWGIVNITPDSFSDGGLFFHANDALKQARLLVENGADFIDIGAASSRPTSGFISAEEEWARLEPIFNLLSQEENKDILAITSLDTWRAEVAKKALIKGIPIINDISAFEWECNLLDVILEYQPYYVLMHCKGKPDTMQDAPHYANVVDEVYAFFEKKINLLEQKGFPRNKIILDQGIGFGKTVEHNSSLLNAADKFLEFNLPIMAAISRKSILRNIFNIKPEEKELLDKATAITTAHLYNKGYIHHRVHNVHVCKQHLDMAQTLSMYL